MHIPRYPGTRVPGYPGYFDTQARVPGYPGTRLSPPGNRGSQAGHDFGHGFSHDIPPSILGIFIKLGKTPRNS
eukprot:1195810-Rhodomonas_salina.1